MRRGGQSRAVNPARKTKEQLLDELAVLQERLHHLETAAAEHLHTRSGKRRPSKGKDQRPVVANIARDLNNTITVMLGYAELALHDVVQGSDAWRHLEEVIVAGKRARSLLQQVFPPHR